MGKMSWDEANQLFGSYIEADTGGSGWVVMLGDYESRARNAGYGLNPGKPTNDVKYYEWMFPNTTEGRAAAREYCLSDKIKRIADAENRVAEITRYINKPLSILGRMVHSKNRQLHADALSEARADLRRIVEETGNIKAGVTPVEIYFEGDEEVIEHDTFFTVRFNDQGVEIERATVGNIECHQMESHEKYAINIILNTRYGNIVAKPHWDDDLELKCNFSNVRLFASYSAALQAVRRHIDRLEVSLLDQSRHIK